MRRTIGLAVISLMLVSVAQAQTLTPADLVGRWVPRGDPNAPSIDLHADQTLTVTIPLAAMGVPPGMLNEPKGATELSVKGSWSLGGDTLAFAMRDIGFQTPAGWQAAGPNAQISAGGTDLQRVKLDGNRLTLTALTPDATIAVMERVAAPVIQTETTPVPGDSSKASKP